MSNRPNWFSTYPGLDWDMRRHGFNGLFKEQVQLIRQHFHLAKTGTLGVEVATEAWNEFHASHQREMPVAYIQAKEFRWCEFRNITDDNGNQYLTPVFRLDLRFAVKEQKTEKSGGGIVGFITGDRDVRVTEREVFVPFHSPTLIIEFPYTYPSERPRFRVDSLRYTVTGASHEHHMFNSGWMCIIEGWEDWNERKDTVISALNVALDWMLWHRIKFGW